MCKLRKQFKGDGLISLEGSVVYIFVETTKSYSTFYIQSYLHLRLSHT